MSSIPSPKGWPPGIVYRDDKTLLSLLSHSCTIMQYPRDASEKEKHRERADQITAELATRGVFDFPNGGDLK